MPVIPFFLQKEFDMPNIHSTSAKPMADIRQVITDKIIAMLEQGGNEGKARWVKSLKNGMPHNALTKERYYGVNIMLLSSTAASKEYKRNAWLTYKQAASVGATVRKGEEGTLCVYFQMVEIKKDSTENEDEEDNKLFYPMCKPFWLFNVEQIDNLPEEMTSGGNAAQHQFSACELADQILKASGAVIHHGFDRAYYHTGKDHICLPKPQAFVSTELYYATALHELTHWTGHKNRLARDFNNRFGDAGYAFEELVAELGAAYLMAQVGLVDTVLIDHASYIESWISVLKNDKNAIFTASKQANLAYEYILNLTANEAKLVA